MTAPLSAGEGALRFRAKQEQLRGPITIERVLVLPAIAADQLRCQECAGGVVGRARFCETCVGDRVDDPRRVPCADCGTPFLPTPLHPELCRLCEPRVSEPQIQIKRTGPATCPRCEQPIETSPRGGRRPKIHEACLTRAELLKLEGQRRHYTKKRQARLARIAAKRGET